MPLVTELDLPVIDLSAAELSGDGYHRRLAELRRQGWLASSPLAFIVLDRESGEFFLRARATAFPGREIADLFGITSGPLREQIDANILNQQGDRHRRLRALVGPAFTPRAADRWRPAMRAFLGQLWGRCVSPRPNADDPPATTARAASSASDATSCDFVATLAKPYPSLTIAAVLGAPDRDAPRLHEWSSLVQRQFDVTALASQVPEIERAVAEVGAYVEALLQRRRAEPGDDLITALLAAEDRGDRLSHAECVNLVLNVIAGGIDTTQAQLSHALRLFAARFENRRDHVRRVGQEPREQIDAHRAEAAALEIADHLVEGRHQMFWSATASRSPRRLMSPGWASRNGRSRYFHCVGGSCRALRPPGLFAGGGGISCTASAYGADGPPNPRLTVTTDPSFTGPLTNPLARSTP